MKLFKSLFRKTFIGKIFLFLYSIKNYIKDYNYISDTFYSNSFKLVLHEYLDIELKKDWIGRLYGIINPNINNHGNFDISKTIIELDGNDTNNNEYIKHWIYKQLSLIGTLFAINNLYDYIILDIKHVGPLNSDNYLLVFDMVARKELTYNFKNMCIHGLIYGCIAFFIIMFLL